MIDETCWSANFDLISGLRPGGGLGIIGGYFSTDASKDKSWIIPPGQQIDLKQLPQEDLASLSLNFVLTRGDSNRFLVGNHMLKLFEVPAVWHMSHGVIYNNMI